MSMQILTHTALNAATSLKDLNFKTTKDLLDQTEALNGWIAQTEAHQAAMFGLNMPNAGFNMLVLGQHGSGRTSLIQSEMKQVAKEIGQPLMDLIAVFDFSHRGQPMLIKLPAGVGSTLIAEMNTLILALVEELPSLGVLKDKQAMLTKAKRWLAVTLASLEQLAVEHQNLSAYIDAIRPDVLSYLKTWQLPAGHELEHALESLVSDGYLNRFRVNLLVDNAKQQTQGLKQPVIYDNDPNYQSLFGSLEATTEQTPDFLRLRAGNLHKADGGMLQIQLRDLMGDDPNGGQVIEKLYRFLRNGTLQFDDASIGASTGCALSSTLIPLNVKLILVALREDFYSLLEENPDFFDHFPIKVEFADTITANAEHYAAVAGYVARKCEQHQCQHFSAAAVAELIAALQRLEEDQTRISTNFGFLERIMLESTSYAGNKPVVDKAHVQAAINARNKRHQYFETQIRESITDNELLIQVSGEVVGQVNGLTHVELGDASFGSPIRITARCYPGQKGLINIDREVNMSGPNHDKGIFILQNWLNASFSNLAPLSLNASLVFEQEYSGVEGDSASCAELCALLSAMAGLPIQQGIAITGALNQFGEVMPIGGVNEKIEGYFRVCKALQLTGKQGVIIPKRNQRHLLLDDEVVQAVKTNQFHIIAIDHVLEAIQYLVGMEAGKQDVVGDYPPETVMGHAQSTLALYRKTLEINQPHNKGVIQ